MKLSYQPNRRFALTCCALSAIIVIANPVLPVSAQSVWPARPVKIVVPFAPGGTTDILARAMAPELSKAFGQPFVVENRAGAGGNIGADVVAKSAPNGYTLPLHHIGMASSPSLYRKLQYKPLEDFEAFVMAESAKLKPLIEAGGKFAD